MIEKFENVTVLTKGNIYFDGNVQSRTVLFPDGAKKTLGVILPGDYEFGTADREEMEMTAGTARVKLTGDVDWRAYGPGEKFGIPANCKFKYRCAEVTEYICSYYKD